MSEFHRVTERFSVAPQLAPEDMAAAAQQGFVRVVCNRPDGEGPGQPMGAEMKAAAQAAGLEFVHIPFAGPGAGLLPFGHPVRYGLGPGIPAGRRP